MGAKNETIIGRYCGFLAGAVQVRDRVRPPHREHGDYRSSTTAERAARAASRSQISPEILHALRGHGSR